MQLWQVKIPLHQTWHFTLFCAGIVSGLALSVLDNVTYISGWQWALIGLLLGIFACWKRWRWLVIIAFIGGALLGVSRGVVDRESQQVYVREIGHVVTITGRVTEDTDLTKTGETSMRLGDVRIHDRGMPSQIWVTTQSKTAIERSDVVTLQGRLQEGFGSFAATLYRGELLRVQRPQPGDIALHIRDDFGEKVREGIPEPAASLGMGYLSGQRRNLPTDLDTALKIAGLTHIVVASGYNLTILVRAVKRLFEKRSRYMTVFLSAILILGFMAVTGLSPSMTRAGLVASLSLAAWYAGRAFHPATLLLFAAALTGLLQPSYVWGNLGWQLSFAAFGGVMILAPLLQRYFFGDAKPGWVRQVLGETIAAQVATAPLLLYSFGYISNIAVLSNLLVLPLVPLAMLLTFTTGIVGYIVPAAVHIIGLPGSWLLEYMVYVTMNTAHISWAQTMLNLPLWGVFATYGLIIVAVIWMRHATGFRLRESNIVE
ncbi:MAG TPA: ComEC/Rec2 family competence protein [Patescibacteria group bacterium]|jgi:competence protein ComEC|nr:ComEC/Rec2 family competence protein [Patescibacteria group bacterium]